MLLRGTPKLGETVPAGVAEATVQDGSGASVRVGSLWERGPCLLVVLRHFGCIGCAEQVEELAPRLEELVRSGLRVVLVGNGSLSQRADFIARHALEGAPVDVFTDPSLGIHRALGLVRSAWATFGPRSIAQFASAIAGGKTHGGIQGDATQQGGVLLVDARGKARLYQRGLSIADHPAASDLVEAALILAVETRIPAAHV